MREGQPRHSESPGQNIEKEKKRASLNELFSEAKDKIIDGVFFLLSKTDPHIVAHEKRIKKSEKIGKMAGDFFEKLIPESLHKPDKRYRHPPREDVFNDIYRTRLILREAVAAGSRQFYQAAEQAVLKPEMQTEESQGRLFEKESGDYTTQFIVKSFNQDGGENIIKEEVLNSLKPGDFSIPSSDLIVANPTNGFKIDLGQLLPKDFKFEPPEMSKIEEKKNPLTGKVKRKVLPVDLRTYQGTKNAPDNFYALMGAKIVGYGDLTKKGGFLSLFHEIAHAWQEAHHDNFARSEFEEFQKTVSSCLLDISIGKELLAEEEINQEKFEEVLLKPNIDKLKELGVEFDLESFENSEREPKEGEFKIADAAFQEKFYIIKSEHLTELIGNYAREERDAWAHAIRVLRFVKKQGMDLEPELKSIKDIREMIDHSLGTYQDYLDEIVDSNEEVRRFVRRKKEKE
ncbi:hypothetical protein HQ544_04940 [Candidatus Falkowbacteria bacterium]|nr:hypothetical protein [Candidatus Falkowbacteria bacterium]